MWQLWKRSQAFRTRPSELIGLEDPLIAYFLDRGTWFLGTYVEDRVDAAGRNAVKGVKNKKNAEALQNGARLRTLDKLLGGGDSSVQRKFKDPVKAGVVQ